MIRNLAIAAVILVIAVAAVFSWRGWRKAQSAREEGAAWTAAMSQADAASPVFPQQMDTTSNDSSSSSQAPQPSKAEMKAWYADLTAKCAVEDKSLKIEHFDVNGDGLPDAICWGVRKTKAYGDFVDVQARVVHADGKQQRGSIILPVSSNEQFAVCDDANLNVHQDLWTRQQFKDMGWDYVGPISITIGGSDCDPPWLFWPQKDKTEDVDLDFERM